MTLSLGLQVGAAALGAPLGYCCCIAATKLGSPFAGQHETGTSHSDFDSYPRHQKIGAAIAGALATATLSSAFGISVLTLYAIVFVSALLILSLIDLRHFALPDALTIPLMWLGLLINIGDHFAELTDAVLGAMAGYVSLWSIYWLFKIIRGKEGLGYGDFKLCAAIGAWLGWQALPSVIFIAASSGILVAIILIAAKRLDISQPIPFGPFLSLSSTIVLCLGGDTLQRFIS